MINSHKNDGQELSLCNLEAIWIFSYYLSQKIIPFETAPYTDQPWGYWPETQLSVTKKRGVGVFLLLIINLHWLVKYPKNDSLSEWLCISYWKTWTFPILYLKVKNRGNVLQPI